MEAHLLRAALFAATLLSLGASYRTENFIVTASSDQLARAVATAAEDFRRDLAIEWLGQELPPWRDKCPIRVHSGPNMGAGGVTQFMFQGRQPFGWSMTIQGSPERILDSVLPHEITHTVFATHFGRPLPRWADEGACTTVEHDVEKQKQHRLLYEFLTTGRGIAFNHMFAMKEYPPDVLPLYSQGFSLARFLIAQGGKRKFVDYVGHGMDTNNWPAATQKFYGFRDLSELQVTWLEWVRKGSGPLPDRETLVAQQEAPQDDAASGNAALVDAGSGWYARVRDGVSPAEPRAASIASEDAGSAATIGGSSPATPRVATATSPRTSPVTRPQGAQQARQVILEWGNPQSAAAAQANPAAQPPRDASSRSYLVPQDQLRGSILR